MFDRLRRTRGRRLLACAVLVCATLLAPAAAGGAVLTKTVEFLPGGLVEATAFSPAGDRLAVSTFQIAGGAARPVLHMYTVTPGGTATEIPGSPYSPPAIATRLVFSPDGKLLASTYAGNNSFGVHVVAPSGGLTPAAGMPYGIGSRPVSAAFSPAGTQLAIGSKNGVRTFTIDATGVPTTVVSPPITIPGQSAFPAGAAYSPTSKLIAVSDEAWGMHMRSVTDTGAIGAAVPGSPFSSTGPTYVPAFSPNGKLLAAGNSDGDRLSMFSVAATGALTPIAGSPFAAEARELAWSPSGRLLATTSTDSSDVAVYAVRADGVPRPVPGSPFRVGFSTLGPTFGGGLMAVGDETGGAVTIYKVGKVDQTISFPAQGPYTYGGAPVTLGATSTSGLPLTYATTVGPCAVSGTTLTFSGAGLCVVTADQAGDADYDPAPQASRFILAGQAAQTITFPDPGPRRFGDPPVALSATSTRGLPVAYAVTSGPCTVRGKNLTLTGAGSCVVAADQAGTADVAPAARVSRSVTVAKDIQAISFPAPGPREVGDPAVTLGATSTSGLPIAYSVTSGPCTVGGAALTLDEAGTCVVAAGQAGSANYTAASPVSRTVDVVTPPFAPLAARSDASGVLAATPTATPAAARAAAPERSTSTRARSCARRTGGALRRCRARRTSDAAVVRCRRTATAAARRRTARCVATAKRSRRALRRARRTAAS